MSGKIWTLQELKDQEVRASIITEHGHFAVVGVLWKANKHRDDLPDDRWGVHDAGRGFNWAFFNEDGVRDIQDESGKDLGFVATIRVRGDY